MTGMSLQGQDKTASLQSGAWLCGLWVRAELGYHWGSQPGPHPGQQ